MALSQFQGAPFQNVETNSEDVDDLLLEILRDETNFSTFRRRGEEFGLDDMRIYDPIKRLRGAAGPPKIYARNHDITQA